MSLLEASQSAPRLSTGPNPALSRAFQILWIFYERLVIRQVHHTASMGVLKEGQSPFSVRPQALLALRSDKDAEPFQRRTRQQTRRHSRPRMSDKENDLNDALTSLQCRCPDDDVTAPSVVPPSKDRQDFPVYENILFSEACVAARESHSHQQQSVASKESQNADCYYDINLAQKCHKLLHQQAGKCPSTRVMLFPEEEWAKNAPGIQWSIKMNRWVWSSFWGFLVM